MANPYKKPEDGGRAFPHDARDLGLPVSNGLTKREYFAAAAIASGQLLDAQNLSLLLGKNVRQMNAKEAAEAAARSAYNIADAMIKLADKPVLTAEERKA